MIEDSVSSLGTVQGATDLVGKTRGDLDAEIRTVDKHIGRARYHLRRAMPEGCQPPSAAETFDVDVLGTLVKKRQRLLRLREKQAPHGRQQ